MFRIIVPTSVSTESCEQTCESRAVARAPPSFVGTKVYNAAQVFDTATRSLLRQLKGHTGAVHVTSFSPDKLHVLSGGDDSKVWLYFPLEHPYIVHGDASEQCCLIWVISLSASPNGSLAEHMHFEQMLLSTSRLHLKEQ